MTDQQKTEFITYKLARARETLTEVDLLISNDMYNSAMNRLYYACFYAVTALLLKNDIHAKKHSGVKQMFSQHFILTQKIHEDYGRFFGELFNKQQKGDYEELIYFMKEDVVPLLKPAIDLIDKIQQIISDPQ